MRRFEYREGTSSKFWAVDVTGKVVTTSWGRIGTTGQSKSQRFASPAAAQSAADKQAQEKLRTGYVEVAANAARAAAAAPAPAKAKAGPGKFAFTAEYDELFARGYPHLRRLAPDLGKGVAKAVKKELEAIDPELGVDAPADVARAFLSAMAHDRKDKAARDAAIEKPAVVDLGLLETFLKRLCPGLVTETYAFRIHDAVDLFEAFLGTEPVAEAVVARFVAVAGKPGLWTQKDNGHDHAFHVANALGFMRLRMSSARWKAITAPLAKVKKSSLLFTQRLQLLVDPKLPVPTRNETLQMQSIGIALQRGDARTLRAYHARHGAYWYSARFYYVAGKELLDGVDPRPLLRLPAWLQKRIVAEYGQIDTPGIFDIIATLATGRAASKEAAAWLALHGAKGARAAKGAGSTKPLTPAQVSKGVGKVMRTIEKSLPAARGDQARELAILEEAFQQYCEVRAAGGDPTPEAYFGHHMIDLDWDKQSRDDVQRWFDLAAKAMG